MSYNDDNERGGYGGGARGGDEDYNSVSLLSLELMFVRYSDHANACSSALVLPLVTWAMGAPVVRAKTRVDLVLLLTTTAL